VGGAAFSLRYRELAAMAARDERIARVRAGSAAGETWLEIERTGTPETAGLLPHTRLEMHLPTGFGLRHIIAADPDTGWPRYGLERLRLDAASGDVVETPDPPEMFVERTEWEAAAAAARREIESGG
jgi:hypothetical protein